MNILDADSFINNPALLRYVFDDAANITALGGKVFPILANQLLATVFLEPSTRTRLSFEAAMIRLGGRTISVEQPNSSTIKGETLEDTLRTVSLYADAIVYRTPQWLALSSVSGIKCPLINAGDIYSHPTQAILDAYTIWSKFGKLKGLKFCVIGDIRHSRTISSLKNLLSDNTFECFDTTQVLMPDDLKRLNFKKFDVVYVNRVQVERHASLKKAFGLSDKSSIILTKKILDQLPKHAIVLNPGPRQEEMPPDLDSHKKNLYWEQMQNGLYVRMALLKLALQS